MKLYFHSQSWLSAWNYVFTRRPWLTQYDDYRSIDNFKINHDLLKSRLVHVVVLVVFILFFHASRLACWDYTISVPAYTGMCERALVGAYLLVYQCERFRLPEIIVRMLKHYNVSAGYNLLSFSKNKLQIFVVSYSVRFDAWEWTLRIPQFSNLRCGIMHILHFVRHLDVYTIDCRIILSEYKIVTFLQCNMAFTRC